MFTVDRFLGINEAADGFTEVKMGEASAMKNFLVTDACNLTVRPGIRRVDFNLARDPAQILAVWSGQIGGNSGSGEDVFLNDADGTVLVNRYGIGKEGVWCIYNSHLCTNVKQAVMCHGVMVFSNGTEIFYFDDHMTQSSCPEFLTIEPVTQY